MKNKLSNVKQGDIFSESSHYIFEGRQGIDQMRFRHKESNTIVTLSEGYVEGLLTSADQFDTTIEVTKEDSKDGTKKGIRSIWEEIHGAESFTVAFRKQDEPLSKKAFEAAKYQQIATAIQEIEETAKNKKGVAAKAKEVLERVQNNPVLDYAPGELRVLRGYKIQFSSRDGKYKCIDMDLLDGSGDDNSAIRPVNINTIEYLIYRGVKYVVK